PFAALRLPQRAPPPLGYFAETPRAASNKNWITKKVFAWFAADETLFVVVGGTRRTSSRLRCPPTAADLLGQKLRFADETGQQCAKLLTLFSQSLDPLKRIAIICRLRSRRRFPALVRSPPRWQTPSLVRPPVGKQLD